MAQVRPGRLDIVATPIGNLDDLSPRARAALAGADVIAAEDTRRSAQLLNALGLAKPLLSLREHNERAQSQRLIERLLNGECVALVSDAGTPLISDPGQTLVTAAIEAGIRVQPIPGPTAVAALLAVCGLSTERFAFEGFLPPKSGPRQGALRALVHDARTLVFFEAPHRLAETLADLRDVLGGERRACVGRELTKLHETLYRGSLTELAALSTQDADMLRGELSIAVAGAEPMQPAPDAADPATLQRAIEVLARELAPGRAAAALTQIFGLARKDAYARVRAVRAEPPAPDEAEPDEAR